MIANRQSRKRMKPEESDYSIEPEKVMQDTIRKEMRLVEYVKEEKNGLTI
jgi:hypothetical protein